MNEETIVRTMALPYGQDWLWIGDANVVVLASHLCPEGRDRALCEVSAFWRRSCLRVIDGEASVGPATEPFTLPRQSAMMSVESPA